MNSKEQNSNNFGKQSEKIPQNRQAQQSGQTKAQQPNQQKTDQNQRNNLNQKDRAS